MSRSNRVRSRRQPVATRASARRGPRQRLAASSAGSEPGLHAAPGHTSAREATVARTQTDDMRAPPLRLAWQPQMVGGEVRHGREGSVMDEMERRRRSTPDGLEATAPPVPEADLSEREEESAADDQAAARRDLDATIEDHDAELRDHVADVRDAAAEGRDSPGLANDHVPPLLSQRRKAKSDREDAAADRARADDDRDRARGDREASRHNRERASEDRAAARGAVAELRELLTHAEDNSDDMELVHNAQGMLMAAGGLRPLEALLELSSRAAKGHTELGAAARDVVRQGAH